MQDKPIILAGDKKGTLGFFDASQKAPEPMDDDDEDPDIPLPEVGAFEVHSRTISSIKVPMFDSNSVITSSYDSSIRCLDLPTQVTRQLWAPEDDAEDLGITCIDMSPEAKDVILFSTLEGSLGRIDKRTKGKAEIFGVCDHKIGGLSVNPRLPYLVATASLDRKVAIYDLRHASPTHLADHASRLSVSHVSWNRSNHLATSSYDDTIKIYDMASLNTNWTKFDELSSQHITPAYTVPHNNQTGRWVTILKPQWQVQPADGVEKFAIGNMNRFVDIYDHKGKQLAQLDGEGITAVPAVAEFHPTLNWVAGGTASGKLCLWM